MFSAKSPTTKSSGIATFKWRKEANEPSSLPTPTRAYTQPDRLANDKRIRRKESQPSWSQLTWLADWKAGRLMAPTSD